MSDQPAPARVTITTAGHSVTVEEHGATAKDLGELAIDLHKRTRDARIGKAYSIGFGSAERSGR